MLINILNYDSELYNYSIKSSDSNILDVYLDNFGKITLKGISNGVCTLNFERFNKKDGSIYEKELSITVAHQDEIIDHEYDPRIYNNYLEKLIDGFEFKSKEEEELFNFSNIEEELSFDKKGISYKDGWRLDYDIHKPEFMRMRDGSQRFIIQKEFDIDKYSTDDQTVIDPFVIEDLQNRLLSDEFSEKYLVKPKIVKIKKITVSSEEEKQKLLEEFKTNLEENDINNKYVRRVTGLRYKELVNEINKAEEEAEHNYGAEMFNRIKEAIKQDLALYGDESSVYGR